MCIQIFVCVNCIFYLFLNKLIWTIKKSLNPNTCIEKVTKWRQNNKKRLYLQKWRNAQSLILNRTSQREGNSKVVASSLVQIGLCCPQWCLSFRVTHVSGCEGTHLSHSQGLLLQITTSICTLTLSGARSQSRCIPVCPSPSERGSVSKPSPQILSLNPPWTWWWKIRNGLEKSGGISFFASLLLRLSFCHSVLCY